MIITVNIHVTRDVPHQYISATMLQYYPSINVIAPVSNNCANSCEARDTTLQDDIIIYNT